jgi:hypothetical protein
LCDPQKYLNNLPFIIFLKNNWPTLVRSELPNS